MKQLFLPLIIAVVFQSSLLASALLYETFEGHSGGIPDGWERSHTQWRVWTEENMLLQWPGSAIAGPIRLSTPQLSIPASGDYTFYFIHEIVAGSGGYDLRVQYSYNKVEWFDFHVYSPGADEDFPLHYTPFDLSSFSGESIYLSWVFEGDNIQDLTKWEIHEVAVLKDICVRTGATSLLTVNQTEAAIDWEVLGNEETWVAEVGLAGFTPGTGTHTYRFDTLSTAEALFTGLSPSTVYEVYTKADCGVTGKSEWNFPLRFQTDCGIATLPVVEYFQGGIIGALPHCWEEEKDDPLSAVDAQVWSGGHVINTIKGDNELWIWRNSYVKTPPLEKDISALKARFWLYRHMHLGDAEEDMTLLVGGFNEADEFIAIDTIAATNTYTEHEVDFTTYQSGNLGNRLIFRNVQDGTSPGTIRLDYLRIFEAGEVPPLNAQLHYPHHNGHSGRHTRFSWSAADLGEVPTGYRLYLDKTPNPTTLLYDGQEHSFSSFGLEVGESYYWKLIPYNEYGQADESSATIRSFRVKEFFDNFDITDPSSNMPLGWSGSSAIKGGDIEVPNDLLYEHNYVTISSIYLGFAESNLNNSMQITPKLRIESDSELRFHARMTYRIPTGQRFYIYHSNDKTSWTQLAGIYIPGPDWQEFIVDLSSLAGDDYYIGLLANFVLDGLSPDFIDFTLVQGPDYAPVIPEISGLTTPADNTTNERARPFLSWTSNKDAGVAEVFNIYLDTHEDPQTLVMQSYSNHVKLDHYLSYGTDYFWKVEAVNKAGKDTSEVFSFTTITDPTVTSYPWIEDFFEHNRIPAHWEEEKQWTWRRISDAQSNAGGRAMYIQEMPETPLTTPPLQIPNDGNNYLLAISYRNYDTAYLPIGFSVAVSHDGVSFTEELANLDNIDNSAYDTLLLDLAAYSGSLIFVQIIPYGDVLFNTLFLDFVSVYENPDPAPILYTLTLQANPTEGGSVSGAGLYEAGSPVNIEASATGSYTFTGWTNGEGETLSTDAAYTYTMPAEDVLLTANFQITTSVASSKTAALVVFPNPVTDFLHISSQETIHTIHLSKVSGTKVLTQSVFAPQYILNTSSLVPGLYVLTIQTSETTYREKIQVTR